MDWKYKTGDRIYWTRGGEVVKASVIGLIPAREQIGSFGATNYDRYIVKADCQIKSNRAAYYTPYRVNLERMARQLTASPCGCGLDLGTESPRTMRNN